LSTDRYFAERVTARVSESWVAPVLVAVFSAVLVVPRLGRFGLVADEGFSVSTSVRSWSSLMRLSLEKETNGFLYAVFLKLWSSAGLSEGWLRLPSALSVVATVAMTCVFGRRLHGGAVGILAAGMVAVNGTVIQFGQNIRFYAPVTALAVLFGLVFHGYVSQPTRFRAASLVVLGIALPSVHLVSSGLLAGALVISLMCRRFWATSILLLPGFLCAAAVGILVSSRDEGQSINLPFGSAAIADVAYSLTGSAGALGLLTYALLGGLAAADVWRRWRSNLGRFEISALATNVLFPWVIVGTVLGLVLIGSQFTTLMVGRYVIFLIPFCAIGLAQGLLAACQRATRETPLARRSLGGVALPTSSREPVEGRRLLHLVALGSVCLITLLGTSVGAVRWLADENREEWRSLSRALLDEAQPSDVVLFANDSMRLFVEFELLRFPNRVAGAPRSIFPVGEWGTFGTGDQLYMPFTSADVESALAEAPRVWLVVERPLIETQRQALAIRADGDQLKVWVFGRAGVLYLLQR
jgi:hypothetical protein